MIEFLGMEKEFSLEDVLRFEDLMNDSVSVEERFLLKVENGRISDTLYGYFKISNGIIESVDGDIYMLSDNVYAYEYDADKKEMCVWIKTYSYKDDAWTPVLSDQEIDNYFKEERKVD